MCASRIIADSDDDDDFSPVPSPVAGPSSSARGNIPGSSDAGFFQSEFLAHQEAAVVDLPSSHLPNGEELATHGEDQAGAYDPWAIMSSPDPMAATPKATNTARLKAPKTSSKKERPTGSAVSPTDAAKAKVPASKNTTPPRTSRTYLKKGSGIYSSNSPCREVIDLVSPDQREVARPTNRTKRNADGAENEYDYVSPRPAKKKKRISELRIGDSGSLEEGNVGMPLQDDTSMAPPTTQGESHESDARSQQLYVEPSRMTSSQKGQYEEVSFPSLNSLDEPPDLNQYTNLARSSGSATIAYPTPTQYRLPAPPSLPQPPQDFSPTVSRRPSKKRSLSSLPPTADHLNSSPDVISGGSSRNRSRPAMEAEPPIVEEDNSCDEDWNETDFGFPQLQEQQPARTKKQKRATKHEPTEPQHDMATTAERADDTEAQANVDKPFAPKKRGRKRKDEVPDGLPAAPAAKDVPPTGQAAPQKRKRGRPKKSDKSSAAEIVPIKNQEAGMLDCAKEESHDVENGLEEAGVFNTDAKGSDEQDNKEDAGDSPRKDDGRGASVSLECRTPADSRGVNTDETSATSPIQVSTGKNNPGDGKGEPTTKSKPGTLGNPGGAQKPGPKPVYRVGLSRRSKITPLLKCIRKT